MPSWGRSPAGIGDGDGTLQRSRSPWTGWTRTSMRGRVGSKLRRIRVTRRGAERIRFPMSLVARKTIGIVKQAAREAEWLIGAGLLTVQESARAR